MADGIVPGTAAIRRRRQLLRPEVDTSRYAIDLKSLTFERRRRRRYLSAYSDLLIYIFISQQSSKTNTNKQANKQMINCIIYNLMTSFKLF
jgi:hypothetical protein